MLRCASADLRTPARPDRHRPATAAVFSEVLDLHAKLVAFSQNLWPSNVTEVVMP